MSNDPILDAMRSGGGGAAVAEQDDPILAAMRSGKKPRLTPEEAKQMGLQPTGQSSMTGADDEQ